MTDDPKTKPREWRIGLVARGGDDWRIEPLNHTTNDESTVPIRVVEYSALERAEARIQELGGAFSSSVRDHNEQIERYEDLVAGLVGNYRALIDNFTQTSKERDQLKEKVKKLEEEL